ncbi:DUF721 domain-containing protein [Zunongwangia atlantica]|uniref:RNA-binding protein n=1 Tax=Zunongwangia atlantica 22II14-10F7 TaxID=1185767 RepID=A0A1Y1T2P5_9FLAO|nr:DUF721 domain-containing protein [Zunongwangia atlantica]ORL45298.1 hypothetical protein IIF7_10768 [Zunongwangia atlantica 22II14-10F7]
MKRNNENLSLGDVLKEFVEKNNLEKGLDKVHVRDAWNQQMGPAIQKYTTAIKLQGSTLYVQLSSSVLREELSYGKEKIVKMLNEELGKVLIEKLVLR